MAEERRIVKLDFSRGGDEVLQTLIDVMGEINHMVVVYESTSGAIQYIHTKTPPTTLLGLLAITTACIVDETRE